MYSFQGSLKYFLLLLNRFMFYSNIFDAFKNNLTKLLHVIKKSNKPCNMCNRCYGCHRYYRCHIY